MNRRLALLVEVLLVILAIVLTLWVDTRPAARDGNARDEATILRR